MEYINEQIKSITEQNKILNEQNISLTSENKTLKKNILCIEEDIDKIFSLNKARNNEYANINIDFGISEMLVSFKRKHLTETYCISTETLQSVKNKYNKNNISCLEFQTDINNIIESNRILHAQLNEVNEYNDISGILHNLKKKFEW
jgi:uncharacterized protein related to proFAR isomerase